MKPTTNKPFINGFEYGWANIILSINNTPVIGITGINYKENTAFESLFGIGNQSIARGVSNYTVEGDITIYKSEVIALQKAARTQGVVDGSISGILPFDIIITYTKPDNSGTTTDILKNVQFTENSVGVAQGDSSISITIPLIISHIKWGV